MKRIWKYPLKEETDIKGKIGRVLDVQLQGDQICAWIEMDDNAPEQSITIVAIGTGWDLPSYLCENYISTVQVGNYVWHFYWAESDIV